ncbi:MAG TPA: transcriptional regulator NrdR [Thermoclostridium caenicola]|uniref:Transcriptional repressor NrdR n=1 Tax=Thermoclostridium caenicola TaxID=659425 RepID=A0A1M6GGW7_9FIRM|nr:transcriptional regulator NrdR [Thermoclostridium caenicola]SHJ09103.1 transcriptional repressor NrdR [Thermoclostridium caenicola]HOK43027.1 transcriptional regulator NrdR [Thermoclostridium caenicola]HOL83881.1 transcriptional regulator NrdR [Thermoclostridium caenicola]HOP73074.1 transcriptional regulator NrdR [Thermoclostridium caenicola]HPO75616.1 transcriptional regulator NrdR [Thermoclostridium caenicola]
MKCPYCSCQEDKVIDSRPTDEGATIRRRRECLNCHKRFTTYEKVENLPIMVIKKDGSREPYDRDKVRKGILRATEKRSVSADAIERMLDSIEYQISNSLEREVTSAFIGELVMEKLRALDEVAYVRFASVYRQFKDINTFMDELSKLLKDK